MKRYFRLSTLFIIWYCAYRTELLIEKSTLAILHNQQHITCSTGSNDIKDILTSIDEQIFYSNNLEDIQMEAVRQRLDKIDTKFNKLNKRLDSLEVWISDTNMACQTLFDK